jgi:ubiquinone/menaquinone biosynthesis C-methylase UbiE
MSTSHDALVAAQFGPRARAYVESADHATGADLERLAAIVLARPGGRVLDLGCGGGHVSFSVAAHARDVVAYDLSAGMLAAVRDEAAARGLATIRTEQGAAEAMPFADADFDFVFTRFSAHHWSDLDAGLREMRRVLKPGGLAVVIDTISPGSPLHDSMLHAIELLRDRSHMRNYTAEQWGDALRTVGFRPAAPTLSRLTLDFASWIKRIGTPDVEIHAIRALQRQMPTEVAEHFALQPDGSFTLDTMTIEAEI